MEDGSSVPCGAESFLFPRKHEELRAAIHIYKAFSGANLTLPNLYPIRFQPPHERNFETHGINKRITATKQDQ
jgi:hypothetical protein